MNQYSAIGASVGKGSLGITLKGFFLIYKNISQMISQKWEVMKFYHQISFTSLVFLCFFPRDIN